MSRCFEVLLALQHAALGHVQVVQLLLRWVVPPVSCALLPVFPPGNFVMTVRTGNLLYTSGHLPISLEGEMTTGKVSLVLQFRRSTTTAPRHDYCCTEL